MANQLYGSSSYGYGGGSNSSSIYTSKSIAEHYSSISDRGPSMLYNHKDTIGTGYSAAARMTAREALWPGPPGVDAGVSSTSIESILAGYKRSSTEALYHQSLLGAHNTLGFSSNPLVKRPRFEATTSLLPVYPQRPGEKDCAHYMLTRTCKFGDSCKFDHPMWVPEGGIPDWKEVPTTSEALPERPEAPDCPYFLKTQKCKFGPRCKFNHPKDKAAPLAALENIDTSELPERPSEPPCVFYMKTGKCKFGSTCKFHHPKDIIITATEVEDGNGETFIVGGGTNGNGNLELSITPFAPAMLHNSKGLPIRPGEADCPFYLKTGSCKYGATCRYNHPERYAINPAGAIVSTPAAHLTFGMVNPISAVMQTVDPRLAQTTLGLGPTVYPQRPGQMECDYYMKTGICMFGERCKYHHPIDRSAHAQSAKESQLSIKLTLAGLPRREGAIHCPYYMKTGACKYGVTCRFDHPTPGEVMAAPTSQGPSDDVKEE
ncbi:zinc finger CCCH domain-containing protein 37 isoform X2 [Lactuca sativa]|uniref:zinc finger CCCH domain-containing protein 37 isoform X2 n=1 Tax=Lactuca sativa TaxID=4236 RepID=UPI000CD8E2AB|nr:zinc finger CCCH domain-containing protein 37 isoform X2 [Lactuca sativa]